VIRLGASINISPWGFKAACCEAPLSADTMGHIDFVISMVLAKAGNVKSTMVGRLEGNVRAGILDVMKTFLDGMLQVLS
jgi:hypothetical protein